MPLGKELKAETDISKKQYQNLGDTYVFDKKLKNKKTTFKKYNRSNLIYHSKNSFYEYYSIKILIVLLLRQNI